MASSELEMCESIRQAKSMEELHGKCSAIFGQLGFEHFLYFIQATASMNRPAQLVFSGFPSEWVPRYQSPDYLKLDPIIAHCQARVTPIIWEETVFSKPQTAKIFEEAKEHGLNSVVTFPVRSLNELGMLSLAAKTPLDEMRDSIIASLGLAHIIACYLHEMVIELGLSKETVIANLPQLTAREKECLLWSAEGKTTWEIAQILNISERTVIFHLANAAEKMGATNRRQAVVRAIKMGLIAI